MSEDTDKKTAVPAQEEGTGVRRKMRAGLIVGLGVFLLLVLGVCAYLARQELQNLQHERAALTALASETALLEKNIAALQAQQVRLTESVNDLIAAQAGLRKNMTALYRQQNVPKQEWALAEVEYLLLIATHRLLLEADVETALSAMQAADDRLRGLPDPALLAVRKQLLADMNALRTSAMVDISGLALYLTDLIARTDSLPLQGPGIKTQQTVSAAEAPEETTKPWWRRLLASLWRELKGVIIISHAGGQAELSLLPQQSFFLRQNLRLQLETARYAVLRRDTALLHSSVQTISTWLKRYFAVSNSSVGNIIESLSTMRSLHLDSPVPDISSSLESIRAYIKAGGGLDNNEQTGP